ncbi:MAG: O-antigen ligase domain-containing protein [Chitinophagaceae bacterium]|nr:MAG: O-antigen ligase domain-containing protein [Chitinophagaceae bacterium]
MIGASFFNEYGKYTVLFFMVLGVFYKGFTKSAFLYVFFIVLLIPGIYIGASTLSLDANIRKAIAFNIVGPVCLGVSAVYCFRRTISLERIKDVLAMFLFPIVSLAVQLFLYTPNLQEVILGTGSNLKTSGGFAPNQVSTVLGLAMFVAFARLLLASPSRKMQLINIGLMVFFAYRCIITFSRGGMLTGIIMMIIFLILLSQILNLRAKMKIITISGLIFFLGILIWGYSSLQTGGMIEKRYANQNARGFEKEDLLTGREILIETEIQMFLENPLLGVGVGRNKEVRMEETGIEAATHNEITRMLAEHGSLGLLGLLILFFTPIVVYLRDRTQIFAIVFMVFWLLTINHAAMRIAAPAFIYALSLLKVKFYENDPAALHRE